MSSYTGDLITEVSQELQELRVLIAEVKDETDKIAKEITEISFRIESLKIDKLFVERLEVKGLEIKLKGAL